ncbi:MAG: hypothetical protein IJ357_05565 [Oscillospiraceae bacterium]|nr:hypothetical protein [Oscillospiraceae bacterium]
MEKLLISLYVTSLQQQFDLFVPGALPLRSLIPLITEGLVELSGGRYQPSGRELLCVRRPDVLLDGSMSLEDYRLHNGEELILY